MERERAIEICGQCVKNRIAITMGEEYVPLPDVPLTDMLEACRLVGELNNTEPAEGGKRVIIMTVDPRGLAASYAFEKYGRNPEDLLEAVGYRVCDPDSHQCSGELVDV